MKNRIFNKISILFIVVLACYTSIAQTTCQPTIVSGVDSVHNVSNNYYFYLGSTLLYSFTATNDGTLHQLQEYESSGLSFLPSNYAGPYVYLSGGLRYPWDSGVTYTLLRHSKLNTTTAVFWYSMNYNGDSFIYGYTFSISGRTLIIKVEDTSGQISKGAGFILDRCENTYSPRVVRVPYLTLFNILHANNHLYTSMFFDWEKTNASALSPHDPALYVYSNTSVRFSLDAIYYPKTNGQRNPLCETIYLTSSTNLCDVLPNIVPDYHITPLIHGQTLHRPIATTLYGD